MSKHAILLLITVLVSSFVMTGYAFAQLTPKPSVPEFSVEYLNPRFYVEPTTTTDPYTGQTITQDGYYKEGPRKIVITIKNQPFTKYTAQINQSVSKNIGLFYSVRVKGHFAQDWTIIYQWDKDESNTELYVFYEYIEANYSSQYTILTYHEDIPSSGKMDFQVKAAIGYIDRAGSSESWLQNALWAGQVLTGESSDWSTTQTITIQNSPSHQEILLGVALATVVIAAGLGVLFYLIKRK